MLTFSTEKKQSPTTRPHHNSISGTSRPQHPQVRHILRGPSVQPKLTVGAPNDKYEQEADRVADQIMRMRVPSGVNPTPSDPKIQRMCEECEGEIRRQPGEEEEELLQPKRSSPNEVSMLGPETQSRIVALKQGGAPLPANTRNFFEPRFAQNFSNVRVHTDAAAADSARSVNARAYTLGRDIVFGSGQYAPGTSSGKQLLAHELTHVVQQGVSGRPQPVTSATRIQRRSILFGAGEVRFLACTDTALNDFAVIPEEGTTTFTPTTGGWNDTDGFWWRHHQPKTEWFKIQDDCKVNIICTEEGFRRPEDCTFSTPRWTSEPHGSTNPF